MHFDASVGVNLIKVIIIKYYMHFHSTLHHVLRACLENNIVRESWQSYLQGVYLKFVSNRSRIMFKEREEGRVSFEV